MNVKDVSEQEKLDFIKRHVGEFQDYPKKGILFRDIFTALCDATVCKYLKELLVARVKEHIPDVEFIVGLEARGFLFNLLLAAELGVGCASIRKRGKLPGECMAVEYSLEYGTDIFELQKIAITPGMKIVVIDDLIATGGTLTAAVNLIRSLGGNVIGCMVVMELEGLRGREQLDCNVHSLIKY